MNRIDKVDIIVCQIMDILPKAGTFDDDCACDFGFRNGCGGDEILCETEEEAETLANFFDQLFGMGTVSTGYYDPEEDERNGEVDCHTGYYYVNFV